MNKRSDIDRVLQVWMADGPAAIPDRVVDVVASRIDVQRQRRAWPIPGRTTVNTQVKLIAALAAVLAAAVVGYTLLPGTSGPTNPTAAPTPSAAPTPTQAQPSPTPGTGILPSGSLAAGHYTMPSIQGFPLTLAADVPDGWTGYPEIPAVMSPAKSGVDPVFIGFMVAEGLFSDPCHWNIDGTGSTDQPGDIDEGTTVDDLINALRANTSYTSTAPTPVTVAGLAGVEIELRLPADDVLRTCDSSADEPTEPKYFVFGKGFWAQGANNIWRLFIIDVPGVRLNGTRLITMLNHFADTPQADVAAARAIVESFELTN